MNCRVGKSRISGHITCPPNKSYTHRAIFLASLAGDNSRVDNALFSADTAATIEACRKFGAEIEIRDSSVIIRESITVGTDVPEIDAENSGTTIRIAAGIASLFSKDIVLTGDHSLQKRPMQPLLDALSDIGAQCISTDGRPPISIKGRVSGGDVTIPGNQSSQFISALLISAPLTEKGIRLTIKGDLVSRPYLDATITVMKEFGVSVQTLVPYKRYSIMPQDYKGATFTVPIDSSSLALLFSAAVLNGDRVTIRGSIGDLPQGDNVFIDILERMGVNVVISDGQMSVESPKKLKGGRFDLSDSPDLLPPLAILALNASSPIEIVNVGHARLKETDRIAIIAREMSKIGINIQEREDGLVLESSGSLTGAELNSENDHRLFMAFCIAGMYIGECTVTDPESVNISYPDFIKEMSGIGADIQM